MIFGIIALEAVMVPVDWDAYWKRVRASGDAASQTTPLVVAPVTRPSQPRVWDIHTDTMRPMTEAEVAAWNAMETVNAQ